jgi:hypothetical protein
MNLAPEIYTYTLLYFTLHLGRHENKEKAPFSTLVLELFIPSIANCRKMKIQKIQKSTSPNIQ